MGVDASGDSAGGAALSPAKAQRGDPSEREGAQAHTRQLRHGLISLVVLGGLVAGLLLAVPGLGGVSRALDHVDKDVVLAAIGLEFLSCMGYVLIFQLVFARAPRRFAARLAWTEMAFGSALSFGGAGSLAIGAWVLKTRGVPTARIAQRSAVLFMITSAINIIVLVVFGVLLGLGLLSGPTNPLLTFLPAGISAVVFALFLAIPRWTDPGGQRREARNRLEALLIGFADAIRDTRRMLVTPDWRLLGGYAYLLFDIAVLYICLDATGHAPPPAAVVLAYQIGYLANIVPIPGGIGVLDSGLVGMLVLFGALATPATAAVIVYHAIALWVPMVLGTIAFLLLRRPLGEPLTPLPVAQAGRKLRARVRS